MEAALRSHNVSAVHASWFSLEHRPASETHPTAFCMEKRREIKLFVKPALHHHAPLTVYYTCSPLVERLFVKRTCAEHTTPAPWPRRLDETSGRKPLCLDHSLWICSLCRNRIVPLKTFYDFYCHAPVAEQAQPAYHLVWRQCFRPDPCQRELPFGIGTPSPRSRSGFHRLPGENIAVKAEPLFQLPGIIRQSFRGDDQIILPGPPQRQQSARPVDGGCVGRGSIVAASQSECEIVFRIEKMEFHRWRFRWFDNF